MRNDIAKIGPKYRAKDTAILAGDTNVGMHQVNAERIYSQRTNTHFRSRRLVTVNPWVIEIPKFQQHVYELDLKSIAPIPRNINAGRTWTQRSLHLSHIPKLQNAGPMPLNATPILPSLSLPSRNESSRFCSDSPYLKRRTRQRRSLGLYCCVDAHAS